MTLQELRFLIALADTGHFGKAAKRCHVTQPTLSTGLKKLEDFLGVAVFDRSLKHVVPTPIGRSIVDSARRINDETKRIRELAQMMKDPMQRTLRLGVIPTLGPYYLPHVLTAIHQAHPALRLVLREEVTQHLLEGLQNDSIDAALLALPVDDASLEVLPLFFEPFLVAMPQQHPLSHLKTIPTSKLAAAGLLLLEDGHCLRGHALEACGLDEVPQEEMRATSLETLRQMVGMGHGITLLPLLASLSFVPTVEPLALRPLQAKNAARTIGLVWRQRAPIAPTLLTLGQTLRKHLPAGVRLTPPSKGVE